MAVGNIPQMAAVGEVKLSRLGKRDKLPRKAEINFGIIANIQALAQAGDGRIITND